MIKLNGKTLCINIIKTFFYFICAVISTIMCLGSVFGTVIILSTASFVSGKTITIIMLIILISIFLFSAILCWKKLFYLIIEIKKQYHPITRKNLTEDTSYSAIPNSNLVPLNMPIQKITFDAPQAAHNSEIQDAFTPNAENMIINEELPYKTKQNRSIPNWQINDLIRVIQESYQIISETENPETLCSRYEFALSKVEELSLYYRQNLYTDSAALNQCTEMYSVENYAKLIMQCYYKYLDKAYRELKTQKGIEKRIEKFWTIIQNNVDTNLYLQLRRQLT